MNAFLVPVFTPPMSALVASTRTSRSAFLTTSTNGPRNLVTASMKRKNYLPTTEYGRAELKALASSLHPTL